MLPILIAAGLLVALYAAWAYRQNQKINQCRNFTWVGGKELI